MTAPREQMSAAGGASDGATAGDAIAPWPGLKPYFVNGKQAWLDCDGLVYDAAGDDCIGDVDPYCGFIFADHCPNWGKDAPAAAAVPVPAPSAVPVPAPSAPLPVPPRLAAADVAIVKEVVVPRVLADSEIKVPEEMGLKDVEGVLYLHWPETNSLWEITPDGDMGEWVGLFQPGNDEEPIKFYESFGAYNVEQKNMWLRDAVRD